MKEWLLCAAVVLFNVGVMLCFWIDASDWFHHEQHEARLDELWGPDDEEWAA